MADKNTWRSLEPLFTVCCSGVAEEEMGEEMDRRVLSSFGWWSSWWLCFFPSWWQKYKKIVVCKSYNNHSALLWNMIYDSALAPPPEEFGFASRPSSCASSCPLLPAKTTTHATTRLLLTYRKSLGASVPVSGTLQQIIHFAIAAAGRWCPPPLLYIFCRTT